MTTTTQFTNNASSNLTTAITASATSISVTAATGALFPILTTGQYFYGTLASATTTTTEIVQVTAVSTDTFTVVRGYSGTTAAAFATGDKFELRITATSAANWEAKVEATALTSAVSAIPTNGRQTVQLGVVSATTGYANMLSAGTGLAINLAATAQPMRTAFAQSASDFIATLSADTTGITTIPASNLAFITQDYLTASTVTWGNTLAPKQEGYAYNQAAQSCLSLNAKSTDDFGNTWTNTNVTFSTTSPAITGTSMGVFDGTTSFIRAAAITSLGNNSWTIRCKFKPTSVTSRGYLITGYNSSGYGILITFASNGTLNVYLSSAGSSWDILAGTNSNTTLVNGTSYDLELTYDSVSGKYFTYLNGVVEALSSTTSSLKVCSVTNITLGANSTSAASFYTGSIQGFEILPYCVHPNGVTFTPSTALANVATQGYSSDFYSTPNTTMYQVTGASTVAGNNPTFTAKNRVYVGEAVGGTTAVSSVVSYALKGAYYNRISGTLVANSKAIYASNLGTDKFKYVANIVCKTADQGYVIGQKVAYITAPSNSTYTQTFNCITILDRNTISLLTASPPQIQTPGNAPTTFANITSGNWDTEIIIERLV